MYHSTGVQKLSETQKSKLRNGQPVRIKKAKAFARKHKDLINPIIGRVRVGATSGINKLDSKSNEKVDEYIKPIEGEGIIGDTLKGLVSMTGLGVKPKTLKSTLSFLPTKKTRKGKGILSNIIKVVDPAVIE
jgi:hypothetical protein